MTTIDQVITDLRRFRADIPKKALAGGSVQMLRLKEEFVSRSPIDSGAYRTHWRYEKTTFNSGKNIASLSVFNSLIYGKALEAGSVPKERPWPNVGKKTAIGNDGNIYSKQALQGRDGMVRSILTDSKVTKMASLIADRIMTGLR